MPPRGGQSASPGVAPKRHIYDPNALYEGEKHPILGAGRPRALAIPDFKARLRLEAMREITRQ